MFEGACLSRGALERVLNIGIVSDFGEVLVDPEEGDIEFFEDDDASYLRWSQDHPDGFVINALRGSLADPIVHRAECWSITRHIGEHKDWTHHFVKICGDELGSLRMWSYQRIGTAPRDCQHCDPSGTAKGERRSKKPGTESFPATRQAIEAWLARIRTTSGEADERAAREIVEWSERQGLVSTFTRPDDKTEPERYLPLIALKRREVPVFGVMASKRRVFLAGPSLRETRPFSSMVGYDDLLDRVFAIPGMMTTPKEKYPNISLRELADPATWDEFTRVFFGIIADVHTANG
jgi:hypothetical protein